MPLAIVGGIAIAGAITSAVGSIKAGNAAKKAGLAQQEASNSEAALSDFNANVADLQAQDATERGAQEESRFRTQVRGAIATQRVGFAGDNIDVGYGSAADVQADAAKLGEMDALTIRQNAAREAWGYKVQSYDLRTRAGIERKTGVMQAAAGAQAATTSKYQAAGTLLSTGASLVATKYGLK